MAKLNPSILEYSLQQKTNTGCIEFPHTVPWLKCYSDLYTVSSSVQDPWEMHNDVASLSDEQVQEFEVRTLWLTFPCVLAY